MLTLLKIVHLQIVLFSLLTCIPSQSKIVSCQLSEPIKNQTKPPLTPEQLKHTLLSRTTSRLRSSGKGRDVIIYCTNWVGHIQCQWGLHEMRRGEAAASSFCMRALETGWNATARADEMPWRKCLSSAHYWGSNSVLGLPRMPPAAPGKGRFVPLRTPLATTKVGRTASYWKVYSRLVCVVRRFCACFCVCLSVLNTTRRKRPKGTLVRCEQWNDSFPSCLYCPNSITVGTLHVHHWERDEVMVVTNAGYGARSDSRERRAALNQVTALEDCGRQI